MIPITPTPIIIPEGSVAIDYDFIIPDENLALLSASASSSLLSASNIGKSVRTTINTTLDLIRTFENYNAFLLDGSLLNGLANGLNVNYNSDPGSSRFCRIVIILGAINPGLNPKVSITDGTTSYELAISGNFDNKRLEFNDIPASFVSNFYVINNTGTTLANSNNSILVVNL